MIKDLIEGLNILAKYDDSACTGAEHDVFYVYGSDENHPDKITEADRARLIDELYWSHNGDGWEHFT